MIEHILIYLTQEVLNSDRANRLSLAKLLPDLRRLRADPAAVLAEAPVEVGPLRRPVLAVGLGFFVGVIHAVTDAVLQEGAPPDPARWPLRIATWLAVPAVVGALLYRWLRGGRLVLHPDGVEVRDRRKAVFCPWPLFHASGKVIVNDSAKLVVLPIEPAALPGLQEWQGGGAEVLGERARNRWFWVMPGGQAALRDVFAVSAQELGPLFQEIACRLAGRWPSGPSSAQTEARDPARHAALVRDANGWLRLSLTQFDLPLICCLCGVNWGALVTPKQYHWLRLTGEIELAYPLPVCRKCRSKEWLRHLGVLFACSGAGFLAGLATGLIAPVDPVVGSVVFAIIGAFGGFAVGLPIASWRTSLASFKTESRSPGILWLRFRRRCNAGPLLEAMGVGPAG